MDIADLAGLPIIDCQCVDIGYIILQQRKPFKNSLYNWNAFHVPNCTYTKFKTHFCDTKIALHKTREITVYEGLNNTVVVDMVTEGVQAGFVENTTE